MHLFTFPGIGRKPFCSTSTEGRYDVTGIDQQHADRLHLRLFGGPQATLGKKPVHLSPTQGAIVGILSYAPDGQVPKEELLHLLWDEGEERVLRRRLSQALYSLASVFHPIYPFTTVGTWIRLELPLVGCDLWEFNAALAERNLDRAAGLVQRGFLDTLRTSVSRSFQEWLSARRGEFREKVMELTHSVWATSTHSSDWVSAEFAARIALGMDPGDGATVRRLALALSMLGRTLDAQEVVRHWASDSGDSTTTSSVEALVKSAVAEVRESSVAFAKRSRSPDTGLSRTPIVGRDSELASLRQCVAGSAVTGVFRAVAIHGHAGVGKTRLIDAALAPLIAEGYRVLSGRCSEIQQRIPLSPIIEAMDPGWVRNRLRKLDEPWRSTLAEFIQLSKPAEPVPHGSRSLSLGNEEHRLMESTYRLLHSLADDAPVVLLVDDLQWCDATTLAMLEYIGRKWSGGSLVLVVAFRPREMLDNRLATALLTSYARSDVLQDIELDELDDNASTALLEAVAPGQFTSDEVEELVKAVGGSPLLLELVVSERDNTPRSQQREYELSAMAEVFRSRLKGLSDSAWEALRVFAVASREVHPDIGCAVSTLSQHRWSLAVDELDRFGVIRWGIRGPELKLPIFRDYVYGVTGKAKLRDLHRRVAIAGQSSLPTAELASHRLKSGEKTAAGQLYRQAADECLTSGAYAEALDFFDQSRQLASDPGMRLEITRQMAIAATKCQRLELACGLLRETLNPRIIWSRPRERAELELLLHECEFEIGMLPVDCALEKLSRIESDASGRGEHDLVARALEAQARACGREIDLSRFRNVLARAEQHLSDVADRETKIRFLHILALHCLYGEPSKGDTFSRQAIHDYPTDSTSDELRLTSLTRRLLVLISLGFAESDEGRSIRQQAEALATGTGDLLLKCHPRIAESAWAIDRGDFDAAVIQAREVLSMLEGSDVVEVRIRTLFNLANGHYWSQRYDEALGAFEQAGALQGPRTSEEIKVLTSAGVGASLLRLGKLTLATEYELTLEDPPRDWSHDPTLFCEFLILSGRRRKDYMARDAAVATILGNIEQRFPVHWANITVLRENARYREGLSVHRDRLKQAQEVLMKRSLLSRAREAEQLILCSK